MQTCTICLNPLFRRYLGVVSCTAGRLCLALGAWLEAASGRQELKQSIGIERNRITVVMIRLARIGARKQPCYRIVVIEKDRARNGRSIEVVGIYNPRTNPATVDLKRERIAYWQGVGASSRPSLRSWWPRTRRRLPSLSRPDFPHPLNMRAGLRAPAHKIC